MTDKIKNKIKEKLSKSLSECVGMTDQIIRWDYIEHPYANEDTQEREYARLVEEAVELGDEDETSDECMDKLAECYICLCGMARFNILKAHAMTRHLFFGMSDAQAIRLSKFVKKKMGDVVKKS